MLQSHVVMPIEVDHATLGKLPMLSPPIDISSAPVRRYAGAPVLGQHSVEILEELGYDQAAIADILGRSLIVDGRPD